jgi:N-acetylmuramic acid 6-phosphate (MurNAc-6-P) etherase
VTVTDELRRSARIAIASAGGAGRLSAADVVE